MSPAHSLFLNDVFVLTVVIDEDDLPDEDSEHGPEEEAEGDSPGRYNRSEMSIMASK